MIIRETKRKYTYRERPSLGIIKIDWGKKGGGEGAEKMEIRTDRSDSRKTVRKKGRRVTLKGHGPA